jgi:hypothetical protein
VKQNLNFSFLHMAFTDGIELDLSIDNEFGPFCKFAETEKLRPILTRQLKPGSRIVSHSFGMGDWRAETVSRLYGRRASTG